MSNTYIAWQSIVDGYAFVCYNQNAMEIRELRYFLAVAKEQSISKAAEYLFIAQPSLSKQMQNLEKEIGTQLFIRGSRKITLTETGVLLKKRAEEMIELYDKTAAELRAPTAEITGDIYIGGGESYAVDTIAIVAKSLRSEYPNIKFHFFSGDTEEVMLRLDKGLIDFGILVEPADLSKYEYLRLPQKDTWGVLMRKDSPLAAKDFVAAEDLYAVPLIRSRHTMNKNEVSDWFKKDTDKLNIAATYNLLFNASLLVKEGLGYAIGLDKIINTSGDSELCFRPFMPKLESSLAVAWKKYQVFSKASELFLKRLQEICESVSE